MSDEDLFAKEMGKVTPIQRKARVQSESQKRKHQILRNLEELEHARPFIPNPNQIRNTRPEQWLIRGDGISSKDIKKLAAIGISHEIDLHGLTLNQATTALSSFMNEAITQRLRHINIIHGKGNNSDGASVLKAATYDWLEHGPYAQHILAATVGLQSKGGACHVWLRKQP
ncbi:MAG: hypothetical protein AUK35_10450 [Zetaproteobacteria bacterium CG2_30_46_52]|nr:MAG: hypothetical protein AUK35_10450 [Zetaproteobacteria bacterium CG2_30_46_52]